MKRKVISIILILVTLQAYTFTVIAATASELNGQKADIEGKINNAKGQQADIKEELDEEMKAISELDARIDEQQAEINQLDAQISELQISINEKQKEYDDNEELLKQRIVVMYEVGETSFLDILFNSKGIVDFISNYYTAKQIIKYDSELLETIENDKNIIEQSKQEIEALKSDKVSKQNSLKAKKAERQVKANALNAEKKALQDQIDKYNAEKKKVEDELRKISTSTGGGGYVYTGGQLTWPCPGYSRITSYFGYRGSAATGGVGSSYHNGIDMGAPHGVAILAAESGIVTVVSNTCTHDYGKTSSTRCSCGGGFGNYIKISHGGGLATIYAHCSSISVKVGQTVTAGQQIGKVGSTGYSTGNHLHFGVIRNGAYVNPASYLGM